MNDTGAGGKYLRGCFRTLDSAFTISGSFSLRTTASVVSRTGDEADVTCID